MVAIVGGLDKDFVILFANAEDPLVEVNLCCGDLAEEEVVEDWASYDMLLISRPKW